MFLSVGSMVRVVSVRVDTGVWTGVKAGRAPGLDETTVVVVVAESESSLCSGLMCNEALISPIVGLTGSKAALIILVPGSTGSISALIIPVPRSTGSGVALIIPVAG